jgi:hypothetical protein
MFQSKKLLSLIPKYLIASLYALWLGACSASSTKIESSISRSGGEPPAIAPKDSGASSDSVDETATSSNGIKGAGDQFPTNLLDGNHSAPIIDAPTQPFDDTPNASWKPISDSELFTGSGPSDQEVLQSGLGDCIAFSVLGSLASQNPNAIYRMVEPKGVTPAGVQVYNVHFFDPSLLSPVVISVDSTLLSNKTGELVYDKLYTDPLTHKRVLWPGIVQKALAKYWGSYKKIEGTSEVVEIPLMSGVPARKLYSALVSRPLAISELASSVGKGYVVVTDSVSYGAQANDGSNLTVTKSGGYNCTQTTKGLYCLVNAHEYEVRAFDGNNIELRNPWGYNQNGDIIGETGVMTLPVDAYLALTSITEASREIIK